MFYLKLTLSLLDKKGNITELVKSHIIDVRQEFSYAPLIEIELNENQNVNLISEILFEVLNAYIELYEDISLEKFNKRIIELTEDEIKVVKLLEPINIRLMPLGKSVYCS
jgi:hypothetical protein